jgi:hypothetical protein
MRVIFLDFDGCVILIPANGEYDPDLGASKEAMANLNLLVQVTKAEVVVSSSWREGRTVAELEALLHSWGYRGTTLGKTDDSSGRDDEDRGQPVLDWLAEHPTVESFVVIDDERTDLEPLARRLVSPKPDVGLQFFDVQEAARILMRPISGEV